MSHEASVQPEASIVSVGKGIRYIGKEHCYGYSGVINADGETTYLEFTSGSGYILAKIQAVTDQANGDDFNIKFYLNNIVVGVSHAFFYSNSTYIVGAAKWDLVIPPFTQVKISIQNINSADEWAVMLTGRVYGAE